MIFQILSQGISSFVEKSDVSFVNKFFNVAKRSGYSIIRCLNVEKENKIDVVTEYHNNPESKSFDISINHLDNTRYIVIEICNRQIIDIMRDLSGDYLEDGYSWLIRSLQNRIKEASIIIDKSKMYMSYNFYMFQKDKIEKKDAVCVSIIFTFSKTIIMVSGGENTEYLNNIIKKRIPIGDLTKDIINKYPIELFSFTRDIECLISLEKNIFGEFCEKANNMSNISLEMMMAKLDLFDFEEKTQIFCPVIHEMKKKPGSIKKILSITDKYTVKELNRRIADVNKNSVICNGLNLVFSYVKKGILKYGEVKIMFKYPVKYNELLTTVPELADKYLFIED